MPPPDRVAAPYAAPRLVRYGSIVDLTRASFAFVGPKDGAAFVFGMFVFYFKSL
jgi:hypothetical protein